MRATIIYGCSSSGKSTKAREYVDEGYIEINRDNIRFSVIDPGGDWTTYKFTKENEKIVTKIWKEQLEWAASQKKNIVISDTLLNEGRRNNVVDSLLSYGYDISVIFMHADLDTLIERDAKRGGKSVGEDVIRRQWQKLYGGEGVNEKIYIL